jgi:hypothetical protein
MFEKKALCWFVGACIVSSLISEEATASSITPDMWVYSVTSEFTGFLRGSLIVNADTTADAGTFVPEGCDSFPIGIDKISIRCVNAESSDLAIDLVATADDRNRAQFLENLTATIAFNRDTFVCSGAALFGFRCPSSPSEIFFPNGQIIDFDYDAGLFSVDFFSPFDPLGEISLGLNPRTGGGGYALIGNETGFAGFWDYGDGGTWYDPDRDPAFSYDVSASLVSAPTSVPLPASALMLLAAVALLGPISFRRMQET